MEDAQKAMGEVRGAIVVAASFRRERPSAVRGGYLRDLTRKTSRGEFSIGPMIMALIGNRKREKRTA